MTLNNPKTNDLYEYEIFGTTEEPLASDHIVIYSIARKTTKKEIELINYHNDKSITYIVETDLVNADGPSNFTIGPGRKYKYPLTITPLIGGLYTGSITFYEQGDKDKYIWLTYISLRNFKRIKIEKK